MPWDESTPEYQDAIKRPTVRGGSFGIWLLRNDTDEINLAQVAYISRESTGIIRGNTEIVLHMSNGDRLPITDEEWEMWERFITPQPMLVQMKLQEEKMRQQALRDAANGIVVIDRPL